MSDLFSEPAGSDADWGEAAEVNDADFVGTTAFQKDLEQKVGSVHADTVLYGIE